MSGKILEVQDVTVEFDGFRVLENLNFEVAYGEIHFLIGPNGAGKTTLLDIITGKTRPRRGRVIFDGRVNTTTTPEHKIVGLGVSRKFQTPSIFSVLTVYQNLEAAIGFSAASWQLFRKIGAEQIATIETVLNRIGLTHKANKPAGSLSHGEKQWLEIGMLLTQKPKLLLLDEPVAGMTKHEREKTGQLLQLINKEQDCSVLVVEHDMHFVRQFASKVTVLHQGKLLREGTVEEVQNDEQVIEVYIGRKREKSPS